MHHTTNGTRTPAAKKTKPRADSNVVPIVKRPIEVPAPSSDAARFLEMMIGDVESIQSDLEADLCQIARDVSYLERGAERSDDRIVFLTLQCLREVVGLRATLAVYKERFADAKAKVA